MQEGRFDYYMKELGGFTDEDSTLFLNVCIDYIDFYCSVFQKDQVVLPLSTLISHFALYKKLLGFNPAFTRLLEIGPGCGYLSFFLRDRESLEDYTQIESTESFYLLQSHINSHVFGSRFAEHALSTHALDQQSVYVPKLKWHNPFHYEEKKIVSVERKAICNHFPWWRIGDVVNRQYDIVTSNANLNEFSREALFQYLSLIRDVLVDDGAIIAQCLGGGTPTYESIIADMEAAGFVPVALVQGDNVPDRLFVVSNAIFVGERHPLYRKYANVERRFPMLDRGLSFIDRMYFLNERRERKQVLETHDFLDVILNHVELFGQRSDRSSHESESQAGAGARTHRSTSNDDSTGTNTLENALEQIAGTAPLREVNRLRRASRLSESQQRSAEVLMRCSERQKDGRHENRMEVERIRRNAEIVALRSELLKLRSSRSWRVTKPLRDISTWMRQRVPIAVGLVRWLMAKLR
jgi:hypothetical protein